MGFKTQIQTLKGSYEAVEVEKWPKMAKILLVLSFATPHENIITTIPTRLRMSCCCFFGPLYGTDKNQQGPFCQGVHGTEIQHFLFHVFEILSRKNAVFPHFSPFKVVFSIQKQFKHVQNIYFLSPEGICCDMKVSEPYNNLSGRNENFFRKIVTNCDQDLELSYADIRLGILQFMV